MKKADFWNIKPEFLTEISNKNSRQNFFVFKNKIKNTTIQNFSKFLQNWRKFRQKFRKMWIETTDFTPLFSEV